MKKRLVLLVASFFMTVFGCVGCLGNMTHSNTTTAIMIHVTATDSLILIPPNNGMVNAVSQFSSSNRLSVNFSV